MAKERTKTFPVGLSDEMRARWQRAADEAGVSLAEWIRRAGEHALKTRLVLDAEAAMPEGSLSGQGEAVHAARRNDLATFRGPDLKPSERQPPKVADDKRGGKRR